MKNIMKSGKRIALTAVCTLLAVSFAGCSDADININLNEGKPSSVDSAVTSPAETEGHSVSENIVAEISETNSTPVTTAVSGAVSETVNAGSVQGSASSSVNVKNSTAVSDKISYLIINKPYLNHYSVENGYYRINFLTDKDFQNQINSDIKKAMDKIALSYDPGYLAEKDAPLYTGRWNNIINSIYDTNELEQTNGIAIEVICENGYLSVALGYLDSDGFNDVETGRYGYSDHERYWDVVETLNYDIMENRKIEKLSELFRDGTDISAALNNAVAYYDNDRINTVETDPEHFTIYYTLQNNHGEYYNDYTTLQYFDRDAAAGYDNLGTLKAAEYRDMTDKIVSNTAKNQLFDEKINNSYEVVEEDGIRYSRMTASVSKNADEIKELNEKIKTIQHNAVERFGVKNSYKTDYKTEHPVYDSVNAFESDYFNNMIVLYELTKEHTFSYDIQTMEPVTVEDFIGQNWRDYASESECSEKVGNAPVLIWHVDSENNLVEFNNYYSSAGESVNFSAPLDIVNSKYIK